MGELGLIIVLALHLLCVHVAAGGPLVCVWLEWREGKGDQLAGQAGRYLATVSVVLFVLGVLLGLAVGALLWSDHYRNVLERIQPRVVFGIWEIGFSLALMAIHSVWWRAKPTCSRKLRTLRSLFPLMAGTNLLYHFPGLFAIVSKLSQSPPSQDPISSAGFREMMFNGEVMSHSAHFWMASLTVTGVVLIAYSMRLARKAESGAGRIARLGARTALTATLMQIPIGVWVLLTLDGVSQSRVMGGDVLGTVLFGSSLVAALLLMHQLASVAMGSTKRFSLAGSMITTVLIVMLMTATSRSITHQTIDAGQRGEIRQNGMTAPIEGSPTSRPPG